MKMRYIFLVSLFFMSCTIYCDRIKNSVDRAAGTEFEIKGMNKENTVIAFDLHEVVFQKVHYEMALHILKATVKGIFIYLLNPFFLLEVKKISCQTIIWEDFFTKLKANYPSLSRFDSEFYAAANAQKPVKEVVDFIAYLHSKGYKLYVLSNIGGQTFEHFKKKFPELFKYFSGSFTPDKNNGYICKPNILFYKKFKKYLKDMDENIKYCCFIDDLERNIKSARDSNEDDNSFSQCQIVGFRYLSIDSLKKDFISYGIT